MPTEENRLKIAVVCHSGYRGEETPRSLQLGKRTVEAVQVMDRWLSPDHRYFKILGDDGGIYIVRHDDRLDRWELTYFRQDTSQSTASESSSRVPPIRNASE
ncbi:MAG: hypothetical protein LJE65_16035 [Desulfobacteraceae bacterium]|nr:hypothetical protein [Desulfobacteraceae bacterium]